MRKILLSLIIGVVLIPNLVWADGGVFPDYSEKIYLPAQKAVISWDGEEETMVLSTKIKTEDLANMAWVIPIPSKVKPEIEAGDIEIFYDLVNLFGGGRKVPDLGIGRQEGSEKVEVIEFKKVDIYDIATLKAIDAKSLVNWLNENGYIVPEETVPLLQEYCDQENFYFIANKINLANKYEDSNVEEREIVLMELGQGIATPLKIKFQPQAPFYPLKISSVNEGETLIDVYLFSQTPVKDKFGVLAISQMTKNDSSIKQAFKEDYDLGYDYITYLVYSGNLKNLDSDSWFEEQEYDSALDPNYISLGDRIWQVFIIVIMGTVYYVIPLAIILFAIMGFITVVKIIVNRFRKKKE